MRIREGLVSGGVGGGETGAGWPRGGLLRIARRQRQDQLSQLIVLRQRLPFSARMQARQLITKHMPLACELLDPGAVDRPQDASCPESDLVEV